MKETGYRKVRSSTYDKLIKENEELRKEVSIKLHKLTDRKPNSYKSGNWDGLMSDDLLVLDVNGQFHVAVCFQGQMDGFSFCDFYNKKDYEIEHVQEWFKLPD